jgi:maltose O-acetyltransferase
MVNYWVNSIGASRWLPNRFRSSLLRALGLRIGRNALIHEGVRFRSEGISLGHNVFVNRGCSFDSGSASIHIGDDVSLGEGVILAAVSHNVGPSERRASGVRVGDIMIKQGNWLGARVVVLAGVTIEQGCIIGAGAVVTHDTEPDGVYVGVPARRLRTLPAAGEG